MIRVLITGCSAHSADLVDILRNNPDGEEFYIVGCDCDEMKLLHKGLDARYVVPPVKETQKYLDAMMTLCRREDIRIILPYVTSEIPILIRNRRMFEEEGIRVSVTSLRSYEMAGDKVSLAENFGSMMPRQKVCRSRADILGFAAEIGYPKVPICCKLPDACGGRGFAIVDEEKSLDLHCMNRADGPGYISIGTLLQMMSDTVILQEYIKGKDMSVCCLAQSGKLLHCQTMMINRMVYGAAMSAELASSESASLIAKQVIEESGLDGNVCIDLVAQEDRAKLYLLEVNPRLSASLPFIAKAGLNLPYLRCRQLLGDDVSTYKKDIKFGIKMEKCYETVCYV